MRPGPARHRFLLGAILVGAGLAGCSVTRSGETRYPGVAEQSPGAVVRTYPASATRVAWALTDVMRKDSILDDVRLSTEPQAKATRSLAQSERQALGLKSLHRDTNYNITAKSKDGQKVGVLVFMKGDSSAEVSMLYGPVGDPGLSNALLDQVESAMVGPLRDPGLTPAKMTAVEPKRTSTR